ncbi:MAG: ATP-dependent DNA ligase [Acidobacteriota bacterium]|nr:ATP-dependent DNA ligase [Acidobacteriota bacterium]
MTLFKVLADLLEAVAGEGSRLKKRAAIAEAIRAVHADAAAEAGLFALYLAGMPFAEWDGRKLNAGGALLSRAVKAAAGAEDAQLAAAYRRHGDLGAAAFELLMARPSPGATGEEAGHGLTLGDVAEAFARLASARSTAARSALVDGLLRRAAPLEAKYLVKLMLGDMRTGVKLSLVEEAIAVAAGAAVTAVRHAVMLEADLPSAVERAFAGTLAEARMRLFHPLGFMLASPVESAEEAVARFRRPEPGGGAGGTMAAEGLAEGTKGTKGEETGDEPADEGGGVEQVGETGSRAGSGIRAFLEDKYDGMRAQVHFGDPADRTRVAIYSRNREEITESYPELAEAFALAGQHCGATVLDGEVLGWSFEAGAEEETGDAAVAGRGLYGGEEAVGFRGLQAGRALPFAVLGQRIGRKRVAPEMRARVPVILMAFDLMVDDGELILHLPLSERRNRLEALAERMALHAVSPLEVDEGRGAAQGGLFASEEPERAGVPRLLLSPTSVVESAEDIERAYAAARTRSNEGVMIKAADSAYMPGRRGLAWVKLKRELATLDVVVTGAEYGHGRRAGTLSDYTFAVRGAGGVAELLNVGKAYSGVTDAEIAELTEFLTAHTLEDFGHFRTVEPLVVLEVAFNNVMRSERHASGFALRFPRILRLRPDKPVTEIDTLARVEEIYQSQVDKPVEE